MVGWGPDWYGDAALSFFNPLFSTAAVLPADVGSNYGLYNNPAVNAPHQPGASAARPSGAATIWAQADESVMKDAAIYPITDLQPALTTPATCTTRSTCRRSRASTRPTSGSVPRELSTRPVQRLSRSITSRPAVSTAGRLAAIQSLQSHGLPNRLSQARVMRRVGSVALLEVEDLHVSFQTADGIVQAVRGVSFGSMPGRPSASSGESGSGKSVSTQTIMGLTRGARVSGRALFEGRDLLTMGRDELRKIRGAEIGMIFQDPLSSLHPYYRVGWQIVEMIRQHDKPCPRRRPGPGRSSCSGWSASRSRTAGSTTTRTSSPAACGSGP